MGTFFALDICQQLPKVAREVFLPLHNVLEESNKQIFCNSTVYNSIIIIYLSTIMFATWHDCAAKTDDVPTVDITL